MDVVDDLVEGATDANHRFGDYCGMGGYIEKLQVWWYYEFKDQEVLRLNGTPRLVASGPPSAT